MQKLKENFFTIADRLSAQVTGAEILLANLGAEQSDFVRLNHCAIRQVGSVEQQSLQLTLIDGARQTSGSIALGDILESDYQRASTLLRTLRETLKLIPPDPYLNFNAVRADSITDGVNQLPDTAAVITEVMAQCSELDLVGIYAAGICARGFANSLGQRNWFSSASFNFDWSIHLGADRAIKCGYAGTQWDADSFAQKCAQASGLIPVMQRPEITLPPGLYRAYLAPSALVEVVDMLSWDGFGLKSQKAKQSSLQRMLDNDATLDASINIVENTQDGFSPSFQDSGFIKHAQVNLIQNGHYQDALISPRSAQEFGLASNGANASESPQSIEMAPGKLANSNILSELGTGLYISNLWYLNYSDRPACRMTGMTRFATFWVENGEIVAPVKVMRFDESLYRMLGSKLIGLTQERDTIFSADTYESRSTASARIPGALIADFNLTL